MIISFKSISIAILLVSLVTIGNAQDTSEKAKPTFKDGEAQIVEAFSNPE